VKRKIFGLNAARLYGVDEVEARCKIENDAVEGLRQTWANIDGDSHEVRWVNRGPTSRRGMLDWFGRHGGRWSIG
jgi:hypothetical protein